MAEWWIQLNIIPVKGKINEVLLELPSFLKACEKHVKGWFIIFEPTLWFRVETFGKSHQETLAQLMLEHFNGLDIVKDSFIGKGYEVADDLSETYQGEFKDYGWAWKHIKKLWQTASEMFLEHLKKWELCVEGSGQLYRLHWNMKYNVRRIFHVLYIILGQTLRQAEPSFFTEMAVDRLVYYHQINKTKPQGFGEEDKDD